MRKLIAIVGPTASGKTDLGIYLAKKFNGEIVSADSRQIYKYLDIGTAKPVPDNANDSEFYVNGIRHFLIDIIEPDESFSMQIFKDKAVEAINSILDGGKVPFLVGGTALYVKSITDNLSIPKVAPNAILRKKLESQATEDLYNRLKSLDADAAAITGPANKRRIVRALEVIVQTGSSFSNQRQKGNPLFDVLEIGINIELFELKKRIENRVNEEMARGLADEVKSLLDRGYSSELPALSAVGYKEIVSYIKGDINLAQAVYLIKRNTFRYAKKQMQWFSRDDRIHWIDNKEEAEELVSEYLR